MSPRTYHSIIAILTVFVVFLVGYIFVTQRDYIMQSVTAFGNGENGGLAVSLPTQEEVYTYGPREALSVPEYFRETKERFIDQEIDFIEANLSEMKIRAWKGGEVALEVPIETKGRPGSWWETPAGVYKVQQKKEKHYSSFGHVYMNWNLPFQGNFFIHGWPYYEDGTDVEPGYSGGCIRLKEENAQALYELATVDMPVLVFEEQFTADGFVYEPDEPSIDAHAYAVVDLKNKHVLAGDIASTSSTPIASITKLMTGLIATEYLNLDNVIDVPPSAASATTSNPRLSAGDSVLAFHLLYPLLIESSNEAAETLASVLGKGRYVGLMNVKANAIGMHNTHFVDASGAGAGNVSTVEDLTHLAEYLYFNRSFLLALSAGSLNSGAYESPEFQSLQNYNQFEDDPAFIGGKIGKTDAAKETMVALFNTHVYGTKRPLAYIVLGSKDVKKDIQTLRAHIQQYYGK